MSAVGWSRLDRRLHWIMAALFLWQFAAAWTASALPKDHPAIFHLHGLHALGGYLILALGLWRLLHRLRLGRPPLLAPGRAARLAAHAVHATLYLMIFVQPVTGLLSTGGAGPVSASQATALHSLGAWAILALVGLHAGAAVWHHLRHRDATLIRMLRG